MSARGKRGGEAASVAPGDIARFLLSPARATQRQDRHVSPFQGLRTSPLVNPGRRFACPGLSCLTLSALGDDDRNVITSHLAAIMSACPTRSKPAAAGCRATACELCSC